MGKGEETRNQILGQALAMATRVGLEGLSIGSLAKEVQMSKSGLYAHFESKEDLQLKVMQEAADRFVEHVVRPALGEPRGEARIRGLFDNWISWARAPFLPGGCFFVTTAQEYNHRPGTIRDYLVALQKDWFDTMANSARIAVAEKQFRPDLDVDQFAHDMWSICLVYQYFSRLMRDPAAEARARTAFEALIQQSRI